MEPYNLAEARGGSLPTEDHMVLVEGGLQDRSDSSPANADGMAKSAKAAVNKSDAEPYMRGRLGACADFWREIGASSMVL